MDFSFKNPRTLERSPISLWTIKDGEEVYDLDAAVARLAPLLADAFDHGYTLGDCVEVEGYYADYVDAILNTSALRHASANDVLALVAFVSDKNPSENDLLALFAQIEDRVAFTIDDAIDRLRYVTIYNVESYAELAEHFVQEGLFGNIHAEIADYIDYERLGRDLRGDYTLLDCAGTSFIYRAD